MQGTVSSAGEADSFGLLLILKHQAESGRVVRHFVCSECLGMVEAVQGRDYLHTCEGGQYAAVRAPFPGPPTEIDFELGALLRAREQQRR